jgi:hypothetical protein
MDTIQIDCITKRSKRDFATTDNGGGGTFSVCQSPGHTHGDQTQGEHADKHTARQRLDD